MEIKEFKFEDGLRLRVPFVENEIVWFAGDDICKLLEIDVSHLEELDNDDKKAHEQLVCINEFGLFQLIYTTGTEKSKWLKNKIFKEILPQIIKENRYTVEEANKREELIQTKIKEIEKIESNIQVTDKKLKEHRKNLGQIQTELKDLLKSDYRQLNFNFE